MGRASGSVSQRNEAQGRLSFDTYAPPSLRGYVRIPVVLTSLKPEAARKSIPGSDRSQPKTSGRSFLLRQLECGEIILHVECRDRRRRRYRRVEDAGCCPLANRSALPTSVMLWAAHLHNARSGARRHAAPQPPPSMRFGRQAKRALQAAVMPPTQAGQSETAYLAFRLCASEFVDCRSCLFGRLEHGPEPARHL
jgi:hypothetical protein